MVSARPKLGFVDRRRGGKATPVQEDRGLFKRAVVQMDANLTPVMHRNGRSDLIVIGFMETERHFEVVFAGRRSVMVAPLVAQLAARRDAALKTAKRRGAELDIYAIRTRVMLEGAWRTRLSVDQGGFQTRTHQLVVARWRVGAAGKGGRLFGAAPAPGSQP